MPYNTYQISQLQLSDVPEVHLVDRVMHQFGINYGMIETIISLIRADFFNGLHYNSDYMQLYLYHTRKYILCKGACAVGMEKISAGKDATH